MVIMTGVTSTGPRPAFLLSVLLTYAAGQENASQGPITINTYSNSCPSREDLEGRVSQVEQALVQQQQLLLQLMQTQQAQGATVTDCSEVFTNGNRSDGVYTLQPSTGPAFPVYCQYDQEGLWTVIQRRVDATVDFHRSWIEYKNGFGLMNSDSSFWLGNDKIHLLTSQRQMKLRIQITDWDGQTKYADYKFFWVGDEDSNYLLRYSHYSGTAGDALGNYHRETVFSTFDSDNDDSRSEDCAAEHGGGWWFKDCDHANLNGYYNHQATLSGTDSGIEWDTWKRMYSFKESVMKLKPAFDN